MGTRTSARSRNACSPRYCVDIRPCIAGTWGGSCRPFVVIFRMRVVGEKRPDLMGDGVI